MARVSVITPTYQHASFIGDCIRSVLAQTEQDWEMVIVDDGSEDGTPDIAESYPDPRIVVVRRRHEGVVGLGRAYASAVASTTSPLVAILEGDDTWPPTKLEEQLPLFDNPAVVLAYGSAGLMDERGCVYARYTYAPRGRVGLNDPVGIILPALVQLNFIVAATVIVRRDALARIGGFVQPAGIPYVDHPTWLRLGATGTFARSSRVLGNWRRYPRQVTTKNWFGTVPDRVPYLQAAAAEAQNVLTAKGMADLARSIHRDQARQREEALLARGRLALRDSQWRLARAVFTELLLTGEPRTKAVAMVGLLCSGGRTDMEPLISAMGRHSLPSRRHLASHGSPGPPETLEGTALLP